MRVIPLIQHRPAATEQAPHVNMTPNQITDRLIHTLRMLRDHNEIHTKVTMHVQFLNILGRLHAHRHRRPNSLHFVNHNQIVRLTVLMPLTHPLLVREHVIDRQIPNPVDNDPSPGLCLFTQTVDRVKRLAAARRPRNELDHLMKNFLKLDTPAIATRALNAPPI